MGPKQILPIQVRVDLRVMPMKGSSTFLKALGLEPHHQMQFSVIPRILIERKQVSEQMEVKEI